MESLSLLSKALFGRALSGLLHQLNQKPCQTCTCKNGLRSQNQAKNDEAEAVFSPRSQSTKMWLSLASSFGEARALPKRNMSSM